MTGAELTSTVPGTEGAVASIDRTAAGDDEFSESCGSEGFSNNFVQLGDETGKRALFFGETACKIMFESVM